MLTLLIDRIATPLGEFALVADEQSRLHAAEWTDCMDRMERSLRLLHGAGGYSLKNARNPGGHSAALRAYFAGDIAAIAVTDGTATEECADACPDETGHAA